MDDSASPARCPPARLARRVDLLVAVSQVALLAAAAAGANVLDPGWSDLRASTFFLIYFMHLGITLYDGSFNRLRRWTWPALVGCVFLVYAYLFTGSRLPPGLARVLAASSIPPDTLQLLGEMVLTGLLILDILAMQDRSMQCPARKAWPGWLAAAGTILLLIALSNLLADPRRPSQSLGSSMFKIVPDWFESPYAAMLRSIPQKLGSLLLAALALLAPAAWPWARASWCRVGPMRHPYRLMWAGLAAAWGILVWAGSRPPEPPALEIGQWATAYVFVFLLAAPLLARQVRRRLPLERQVGEVFR